MCHTDKHVESELSYRIRVKRVSLTVLGHSSFSLTMPITSKTRRLLFAEHKQRWPGVVWAHF